MNWFADDDFRLFVVAVVLSDENWEHDSSDHVVVGMGVDMGMTGTGHEDFGMVGEDLVAQRMLNDLSAALFECGSGVKFS